MLGLMQDWPLLIHTILDHAAACHGDREVVSITAGGLPERSSWGSIATRARRLAAALAARGYGLGDRLATLAFNSARHIECWYGIAGMGAVYHTLNPRLHPDQIVWIANHAGDRVLFFDPELADLVAAMVPRLPDLELLVALGPRDALPASLPQAIAYEDLIAETNGDYVWPRLDENTACGLCYTSGTTGDPKGALYSHRSNVLHAMGACSTDTLAIAGRDTILPAVPMFHANGWCIPFAAAMVGAKLVLPGPRLDGPALCRVLASEAVAVAAAVPTVWHGVLQQMEDTGLRLPHLRRLLIGGAACPRHLIETFEGRFGIEVYHAWGMTEMSPIGSSGALSAKAADRPPAERYAIKTKQGRAPYGVAMKIVDLDGRPLPHDGATQGRLLVRGPGVIARYFKADAPAVDAEGWFDTGDIATIDPDGYMAVTDRAKDMIKSGGEWISSLAIENLVMGHPAVAEAAVIGIYHPKWDERPLLIVALKPGQTVHKEDILAYLSGKIAKWWMPDDIRFVDAIPHSATGKIQKLALRQRYAQRPG